MLTNHRQRPPQRKRRPSRHRVLRRQPDAIGPAPGAIGAMDWHELIRRGSMGYPSQEEPPMRIIIATLTVLALTPLASTPPAQQTTVAPAGICQFLSWIPGCSFFR